MDVTDPPLSNINMDSNEAKESSGFQPIAGEEVHVASTQCCVR